ncbi:MAG: hypothetical protein M3094_11355, partial [Actinomycetia bacterium]|nr:hypothetical protein [Actinomycetes bacterium]
VSALENITAVEPDSGVSGMGEFYWVKVSADGAYLDEGVKVLDLDSNSVVVKAVDYWLLRWDANDQFNVEGNTATMAEFEKFLKTWHTNANDTSVAVDPYFKAATGVSSWMANAIVMIP